MANPNLPSSKQDPLTPQVPAQGLRRNRDFLLVWGSGSLIWPCRWMEWVILALLVLELTDSPFQVALVSVSYWIPMLLLSPLAGVLADRVERWHILAVVHIGSVVISASLLALVASNITQPWHVFCGTLALGVLNTLEWPTRSAFVHDLVGSQRIVRAMSMQTFSSAAGSLTGPLIGGFLIELVGFQGPLVFTIVTYSLSLVAISLVKGRSRSSRATAETVLKGLVGGVRYVRRDRFLLGLLGVMLIANLTGFSTSALFPVIARDYLHVGPGLTGALVSAQGLGMLMGGLGFGLIGLASHRGRLFAMACAGWLLSLVAFSFSPWYSLSFVMLVTLGVAVSAYFTLQMSLLLTAAEPRMRGRVVGLAGMCVGSAPLGSLAAGAVANSLGAPTAIMMNAVAGLVLLVPLLVLTPLVRQSSEPPRTSPSRDLLQSRP